LRIAIILEQQFFIHVFLTNINSHTLLKILLWWSAKSAAFRVCRISATDVAEETIAKEAPLKNFF
jgi:hypothetical protein